MSAQGTQRGSANYTIATDTTDRRQTLQILDGISDGMSNQQEFTFGLNPTFGSSVNPITTPLAGLTGKFTYTRLAASGLTYTVHTSTDLLAWPAAAATQFVTGTVDGVETVEVTLTDPPPAGGKLFVRVQAQ